jgi:glutamate transport system permease protein
MTVSLYDPPSPSAKRIMLCGSVCLFLAAAGFIGFVYSKLLEQGVIDPELWSILGNSTFHSLLFSGLLNTFKATALAMVMSLAFGWVLLVLRISPRGVLSVPARWIIQVLRGIPVLVLVFLVYLGSPSVGIYLPSLWALVLGLALYNGPATAEIFRAGISDLPAGQWEAAFSIGMRRSQAFRKIVLPQALNNVLPNLVSLLVMLIKEAALGFVVGYGEFVRNGKIAIEALGPSYAFPIYCWVAFVYVVICLVISYIADRLRKHRVGGSDRLRARQKVAVADIGVR